MLVLKSTLNARPPRVESRIKWRLERVSFPPSSYSSVDLFRSLVNQPSKHRKINNNKNFTYENNGKRRFRSNKEKERNVWIVSDSYHEPVISKSNL